MEIDINDIESSAQLSNTVKQEELRRWTSMIERTAREICGDTLNNIILRNTSGTLFDLAFKEEKSADCLVQAIDRYIHSMPIFLQGVFQKLATEITQAKFSV
ncbi:MAG TPA: hypothetical protein VJ599_10650 [Nitrososphaeraceae archaeon]|nr:hypothetical protein [Nitrososphaeraceae archaeon]